MSIIGPRPGLWNQDVLTAERDKYGANDVKPGLTGWAQINGRDELEIPEKAKLDGYYVQNMGFKMDNFNWKNDGRTKVMIGCGTRPEIIRLAAVIKRCREYFDCCVVYYNQNWDRNLSTVFWEDFELTNTFGEFGPDILVPVVGENLGVTCGNILGRSYELLSELQPDGYLVLGDTNSCLSAISAKRLHIPLFHMEAGNRCKDGKNRTRNIQINEIYEYDLNNTETELDEYCTKADFVFNLAGVNRPENPEDFMKGNFGFASQLLDTLKKHNNKAGIMLSSSVQATLAGRFGNSEYGRSKKAGEELFFTYGEETGAPVYVYRFVNLMGHSRPKYNSAISTFCWAVANDEEFTVNDRSTELEVLYIDDLVEGMFDLLEGKEQHCEFDGVETVLSENGRYCCVSVTHKVTLGEIVDLLEEFKAQPVSLMMPKCPEGSFAKKLFSLYLTYLPADKFKYAMKMNCDDRGSFTELVHTVDCGQVSINISKPGITKGQHWHNSKWEQFIVVHGHGLIQERNINTGETVEFEVSGDKIEAIYMIPGWTHNIINLSETDDLVTVMTCNEIFDPGHPDTFFEPV